MKLMIHGGFFSESHTNEATKIAKQDALKRIVKAGYEYLQSHSAVETVVYTVSLLEDDELFNAGTGSQIQSDGVIRMSAAVMDGTTLKMSGVINIESVKNPILVAKELMPYDDRILGGAGANLFAKNQGFKKFDVTIPQRQKEYEANVQSNGRGTVGCVALDRQGKLAAATSTGGKGFEIPGRISDSATVAGNYANADCSVSMTGVGEDIVSLSMASAIVNRVSDGMTVEAASNKTFKALKKIDGFAGAIILDAAGNMYTQDSHPKMVFAGYDGTNLTCFE